MDDELIKAISNVSDTPMVLTVEKLREAMRIGKRTLASIEEEIRADAAFKMYLRRKAETIISGYQA